MEEFLTKKFKFDLEVVDFHKKFLEEYEFLKPKDNFLITYDFIISSVNNVKDIDPEILDTLGEKLYEDITSLYKFYKQWKKRRMNYHKYYIEYLYSLPELKKLYDRCEKLKEKMDSLNAIIKKTDNLLKTNLDEEEFKKIKKQNVDAIYEYSLVREEYFKIKDKLKENESQKEKMFREIFNEFSAFIINSLEEIINIKLFYFAKYYSLRLEISYLIQKFAIKSGIELSLGTIAEYFFKNNFPNRNVEEIKKIIKGVE